MNSHSAEVTRVATFKPVIQPDIFNKMVLDLFNLMFLVLLCMLVVCTEKIIQELH